MLHSVLRNKIEFPEFRAIYDLKINPKHRTTRDEYRFYINQFRKKFSSEEQVDTLAHKQQNFPEPGSWYANQLQELERVIYEEKTVPDDFIGQWRSIELELIFNSKKIMKEFATLARSKGWTKYLTIKADGSLRNHNADENGYCREVIVSYRSGNEDFVREVCSALKSRAYVNETCGAHVHFDFRNSNEKIVRLCGARLARAVPALKTLLPASRRNNRFCQANINNLRLPRRRRYAREARYTFINLHSYHKYQTLEVRGHSGTINADKILNWIKICEIIMNNRIRFKGKEITSTDELINLFDFDADLVKFIKERSAKFNTPTVGEGEDFVPPEPVTKIAPVAINDWQEWNTYCRERETAATQPATLPAMFIAVEPMTIGAYDPTEYVERLRTATLMPAAAPTPPTAFRPADGFCGDPACQVCTRNGVVPTPPNTNQ